MATYVLIHGGGDSAFHWHLLEPQLRARGHDVVTMDLPCEDDHARLRDYADTVVSAIGDRTSLILVAQSLGGFTAPLVCEQVPVELLVLLQGMVLLPGERGDDWTTNTGYQGPTAEGEIEIFYHDVPPDVVRRVQRHSRRQSDALGKDPYPLERWPEIPTRYLLCLNDRMFPAEWMREVVRERLAIEPDEIESGHCPALSRPRELAERLETYRTELGIL
jgi:pimeloyl-ACP methyl ester carboxylesterase